MTDQKQRLRDAGRELDARVAEKLFGWTITPEGRMWRVYNGETGVSFRNDSPTLADLESPCGSSYDRYSLPAYSECIEAAFQVVEKMRERKMAFVLGANGCANQFSAWFFDGIWALARPQNAVPAYSDPHLFGSATSDTAARAICLAAIEATEKESTLRTPEDK